MHTERLAQNYGNYLILSNKLHCYLAPRPQYSVFYRKFKLSYLIYLACLRFNSYEDAYKKDFMLCFIKGHIFFTFKRNGIFPNYIIKAVGII